MCRLTKRWKKKILTFKLTSMTRLGAKFEIRHDLGIEREENDRKEINLESG